VFGHPFISEHLFHASFADSVSVEHFEQFSELVFLAVVPALDKHHFLGSVGFGEVDQVEESALVELVNGDVSEPDEEPPGSFFEQAVESGVTLRGIQSHLGFELKQLEFLVSNFNQLHQFVTRAMRNALAGFGVVRGAVSKNG